MRTTTVRDSETGFITVRLSGLLSRTTASTVRAAVGKAAAECPAAVLVDLSALGRDASGQLTTLATASYRAHGAWGVPVLFYGGAADIARELVAYRSFVIHHADRDQALAAVRSYVPRWLRRRLGPVPANARAARRLVDEACTAWNLPAVREDARIVVTELAANAILHAASDFEVVVCCSSRYLRVAVQDASTVMPRAVEPGIEHGRGLHLIAAVSTHSGATRIRGGKIVWALLATDRQPNPLGGTVTS
ncbi:ATP-binding protein [Actinoplanes sp. NPDC048988]|uniref:ATP-binding protein n=1 Tax=Actinoplanes sp. NPDC048988 TaxID=3363901 RepID=UPI00371DE0AF